MDDRSQPSYPRNIASPVAEPTSAPTSQPVNQPTNPPVQPTETPRVGDPGQSTGGSTGSTGTNGDSSTEISTGEDPCAPGKDYYGPYCGWSPRIGGDGDIASVSQTGQTAAPKVKGLSYTGSGNLAPSDIILLIGILCLALYLRSKMPKMRLD